MPSFDHEILVELFRSRGEIAAALLRAQGIEVPHRRAEVGSIDFSQVVSTEYRADAVILLRDEDDVVVTGVIVEVQRRIESHKHLTWPVYVATLRAKLACPVILLVITPDPKVAAWARAPISLGSRGSAVTPVVIGFADVPRVRNGAEARRLPELAVLSAMAHPHLEIATTALDAILPLPSDQRGLYLDLILTMLPAKIRRVLEARMEGYKFTSEFALRHYGKGRSEGRKEGLQKGRKAGLQKGREAGLQSAVIALARAKQLALTKQEVAAIRAATDETVLTELIATLGIARDADAARTALGVVLAR